MKTQSQIFDFGRFAMTLRHDLMLNGKLLLLKVLMMIAAISLISILMSSPDLKFGNYESAQLELLSSLFKFFGLLFCALGASLFMEDMGTNGQRLNALMSPASHLEKYLSRVTIYVIGMLACYLISFTLADIIRVVVLRAIRGNVDGLHFVSIPDLINNLEYPWLIFVCIVGVQSIFVLGSTVWQKNSFLKTFGALTVIQIVLSIICNIVFNAILAHKSLQLANRVIFEEDFGQSVLNAFLAVIITWTVFGFVTSYFRFKESEIINRF